MEGKKYLIASAALCGLSLISFAVGIAVTALTEQGIDFFFIMLAACIVSGYVANVLVKKVRNGGKIAQAVLVLSYLQYLAPFGLFWLIKMLIVCIKSLFKTVSSDSGTESAEYTVMDGGFERRLKFFDNCTDRDGVRFKKYRDDCGNYWRTYDDGGTFVKD